MQRVAIFQMTSGIDPEANARAIVGAIGQATAGVVNVWLEQRLSAASRCWLQVRIDVSS